MKEKIKGRQGVIVHVVLQFLVLCGIVTQTLHHE